jgi:hypothetical protein
MPNWPISSTSSPTVGVPSLHLDVEHRRWDVGIAAVALASLAAAPVFAATRLPGFTALWPLAVAFAALFGWGGWVALAQAGWLPGSERLVSVSLSADGIWTVTDSSGRKNEVVLNTASRVAGGFVYLLLECTKRRHLLLGPGDAASADLRRLGVRLRLRARLTAAANFLPLDESTKAVLNRRFFGAEPSAGNSAR